MKKLSHLCTPSDGYLIYHCVCAIRCQVLVCVCAAYIHIHIPTTPPPNPTAFSLRVCVIEAERGWKARSHRVAPSINWLWPQRHDLSSAPLLALCGLCSSFCLLGLYLHLRFSPTRHRPMPFFFGGGGGWLVYSAWPEIFTISKKGQRLWVNLKWCSIKNQLKQTREICLCPNMSRLYIEISNIHTNRKEKKSIVINHCAWRNLFKLFKENDLEQSIRV